MAINRLCGSTLMVGAQIHRLLLAIEATYP